MKFLFAFIVGGFICAIVQFFIDLTKLTPARILVSLVVFGVFLGAVGLYSPIFDFCGAGISVPLIGFGANISKITFEEIDKSGALGILKGPFTAASIGTSASLILAFVFSIFKKGMPKRYSKKQQ